MPAHNGQTILIVDDSAMNRALLADIIGDDFNIIEAENGVQAIAELQKHGANIALVLLDIVMPEMDGFGVLEVMNKNGWITDIPVIMVSSESASAYAVRAYDLGVTDFINRPFDANIVRKRVVNTLMLYGKQKALIGMVADQMYERERDSNLMVQILSHIVEFRNGESGAHVLHVSAMTEILLNALRKKTDKYDLSDADIALISMASSLHDIGKIVVPDEVLNKPGRLTDEEFDVMKTHTTSGAQMLDDLPQGKDEPLVKAAYEIARWHHERYDGRGYPDGLSGDDIPISAQVVALADVYDALTSERVYKPAFTHDRALEMITGGECGTFNPLLMEVLVDAAEEIQKELTETSYESQSEKEIARIADAVNRSASVVASGRTLDQLEYERMKYQFFASMSNETQYEYTDDPSMALVSDWGNNKLGFDEIILNPYDDPFVQSVFGVDELQSFHDELRATTPASPIVERDQEAHLPDGTRWLHITARAIWSGDEPPRYTGSIGKIVDIHERRQALMDLERKATHDSLTGVLNHKAAQVTIQEMMEREREEGNISNLVLIVLDMDKFKDVNDTHGHLFGDRVLQYLADKLVSSVRENDIVSRVGGDEFLLCLDCPIDPHPVIDRILHNVCGDFEGTRVSISLGATIVEEGDTYDDAFHRADLALYHKKRTGRGGSCFYEEVAELVENDNDSVISVIESDLEEKN